MREQIVQIVAALIAALNTSSDDKKQVADLKGRVADLQAQLKNSVQLTDGDVQQINAAVNLLVAATPPTPSKVEKVASVPASTNQSAGALPQSVVTATPPELHAAASVEPANATTPVAADATKDTAPKGKEK